MKRYLVPSATVVALMLAAPSVAFAQDTGPESVACETAGAAVLVVAAAAVEAGQDVADFRADVLAGLQLRVNAANDALEEAVAARNALPEGAPGLAAALEAIVEAEAALRAAVDALAAAAVSVQAPADLQETLADAEAELQLRIGARTDACEEVEVPPTSTLAPAPTTVTPLPFADCDAVREADAAPILSTDPRFKASLDSDNDGIGCELNGDDGIDTDDSVTVIPSDAPETGEAPPETLLPIRIALVAALLNLVGLAFVCRDLLEGLRR